MVKSQGQTTKARLYPCAQTIQAQPYIALHSHTQPRIAMHSLTQPCTALNPKLPFTSGKRGSDGQGFEQPRGYTGTGTEGKGQGMDLKTPEKPIPLSRVRVTLVIYCGFLISYNIIIILARI
jgi:hypothetical protein